MSLKMNFCINFVYLFPLAHSSDIDFSTAYVCFFFFLFRSMTDSLQFKNKNDNQELQRQVESKTTENTDDNINKASSSSLTSQQRPPPKIYTRTGDHGTSGLLTGERRSKDDLIFDVLGTCDELSSSLGICIQYLSDHAELVSYLQQIQCRLFEIGSCVAANFLSEKYKFDEDGKHTLDLESQIDQMTQKLEPLKNFILPVGPGVHLHFSRAVCRRCERSVQKLIRQQEEKDEIRKKNEVAIYLNRLSDYLFTLARYVTKLEQKEEIIYRR